MDKTDVRAWFGEYLEALAARGRGETDDMRSILEYYGTPLLVATDEVASTLTSDDEILGFGREMVDGMRAASFHRIVTIDSEVIVLNGTSALYKGEFARERADGTEIGRLVVTYLITDGSRDGEFPRWRSARPESGRPGGLGLDVGWADARNGAMAPHSRSACRACGRPE